MRKLNLLKPKYETIYMRNGKGQEVNYLYIPKELGMEALTADVKAGAAQFAECLEFAKKKPSRMVIIDCTNKEEGLMAATYLSAIYNHQEKVYDDFFEIQEEELPYDAEREPAELDMDDFCIDIDWEDVGEVPIETEEGDEWEESPQLMPVIKLHQLVRYTNDFGFNAFPINNGYSLGPNSRREQEPYWLTTRQEPVCILSESQSEYGNPFFGENALLRELKRFEANRHVFVVLVHDPSAFPFCYMDKDISSDGNKEQVCELMLEYTAGLVKVTEEIEKQKKYYQLLFENWALEMGKKLEKNFPKVSIVEQIISMNNPNKSELIEKVYRYVLQQEEVGQVLTKEDFAVLKKFRLLGSKVEKEEQKSQKRLETQLVGMDKVKKQLQDIVDVMKFNKMRAQRGIGTGGYHNVHLLLGAPGTAKTTIAELLGNIMCEQKLLPGNRFIAINGADLKALYVGHSAPKTKSYFDNYDIILIDEAYSVATENEVDSFSQEAIAQLIIELEKHGMDKLVMFAGYGGVNVSEKDNKMKQFLDANPGIRSRINSTIYFDSYSPEEMVEIVHCHARMQKYQLSREGDALIKAFYQERVKATDFGNGREARSLLENISKFAAARVMRLPENKITKKVLQELTVEDVRAAIEQQREAFVSQRGQTSKKCGFK